MAFMDRIQKLQLALVDLEISGGFLVVLKTKLLAHLRDLIGNALDHPHVVGTALASLLGGCAETCTESRRPVTEIFGNSLECFTESGLCLLRVLEQRRATESILLAAKPDLLHRVAEARRCAIELILEAVEDCAPPAQHLLCLIRAQAHLLHSRGDSLGVALD